MRFLARIAVLAGAAACFAPATALAASGPNARLAAMAAAVRTQDSVHYVSTQRSGTTSLTMDCDAGRTSGIQRITYREGGKSGKLTVIVAKRTAYIRGDAFTLRQFMGLRASDATRFANTWLLVPASNSAFPTIADDVTFASAVDGLRPAGALANVPRRKLDGRAVIGVRGTSHPQGEKVVDTLWLSATGKPLPVGGATTARDGSITIAFSGWGDPVRVKAPQGAIDPTKPTPPGVVA